MVFNTGAGQDISVNVVASQTVNDPKIYKKYKLTGPRLLINHKQSDQTAGCKPCVAKLFN